MVVDDNGVNQKVVQRMVTKLGYEVDCAANGLEAVAAVNARSYDMVLMDCQMPEMDGFEATTVIRRGEPPRQHLPIVAMTANVFQEDKDRCFSVGMDDFISKPMTLESLGSVIERWVSSAMSTGRGGHGQSAAAAIKATKRTLQESIDMEVIRLLGDLGAGDENTGEFLREMVTTYLKIVPAMLASIQQAMVDNDAKELEHQAHKLKGASRNLGAKAVADICERLEVASRGGVAVDDGAMTGLHAAFAAAKSALEEVANMPPPGAGLGGRATA